MNSMTILEGMSDSQLLAALDRVVSRGRGVEAEVVAHLAEVDARRLHLGRGCSSMHGYCTEVLHMSDGAAYMRIAVARAARKHSVLLDMLADGRLHLSGLARLAPHLTELNRDRVLARAVHRSKRQIEELVAELSPKPDVRAAIRKLPGQRETGATPRTSLFEPPAAPAAAPAPAVVSAPATGAGGVAPLSPNRYKVQFTASAELEAKLGRLRDEMRHQVPDGDLATLIEIAVSDKLAAIERRRYARAESPRKTLASTDASAAGRYIPAAVRRAVRERDGEQCTFVAEDGRRCTERGGLELHHEDPFGKGGAHQVENVRLLCRPHNQHLAERDYGAAHMQQFGSRAEEPRAEYGAAGSRRAPGRCRFASHWSRALSERGRGFRP